MYTSLVHESYLARCLVTVRGRAEDIALPVIGGVNARDALHRLSYNTRTHHVT